MCLEMSSLLSWRFKALEGVFFSRSGLFIDGPGGFLVDGGLGFGIWGVGYVAANDDDVAFVFAEDFVEGAVALAKSVVAFL